MTCGIKVRRVKAEVATLVPTHDTSRLPSRNLPSGPFGVVVLRRRLLTLFSFPSLAALFVSPTSSYRCLLAASLRRSPLRRIPSTSLAIIDGWLPSSIPPDLLTASAASTEHMEEETEQSRATQENTTVAIVVIQDGNKCDLDASPKGKDVVEPPSAGMMFKCIDELYEYYKTYGNQVGFPVFKKSTKNDKQGRLHFVTLSCGRGGKSRCKREKSVNPSLTMKIECNAKLNARVYDDGVVRVTSVFLEHNHELSPTRARYLPRRRSVSTSIKRRREKIDQADVTKFILPRWRKDLRREHTKVKVSYNNWNTTPEMQRYDLISKKFAVFGDFGCTSEENTQIVLDFIEQFRQNFNISDPLDGSGQPIFSVGGSGQPFQ
ncbi:hypothetical protein B296_00054388 [Ensete ventricosum]|uniref:Protein FAR1-RELATED SEQUENCE n=1 Tax=Ensete ventricosum TaxID=4639 RepID=A0A426Y425_ENSVE|nr:hypothetical protein B296_00054388 [Ensete ventricosum]